MLNDKDKKTLNRIVERVLQEDDDILAAFGSKDSSGRGCK